MRLVDEHHAVVLLRNLHQLGQPRYGARGTVDRVDHDDARAVASRDLGKMLGIVVTECMGWGSGSSSALPQGHVRQTVKIDRGLRIGDDLEQAQVGRVARLAQQAVFLPEPGCQALFNCDAGPPSSWNTPD